MPQPVRSKEPIHFWFEPGILLKRPNLAAHIANISSWWNEIEARIAAMLAALLGGEAKTGISIFFAITNDGAKKAAIDAICAIKLSRDDREIFQKLQQTISRRYQDRNTVVHGAWGISDDFPGKLLWGDMRDSIRTQVEITALHGPENKPARDAVRMQFQKTMQVWDERDFFEAEKRLKAAHDQLRDFSKPIIDEALAPSGHKSS